MTIVEARLSKGLTQQEVADMLGVSRPTYIRMEKHPEDMTIATSRLLSEILGMPLSDFFSLETIENL